jgi:hypothetical protein
VHLPLPALAVPLLAASLLGPSVALAQTLGAAASPPAEEEEAPPGPPRPRPPDERTGHILLTGRGGVISPFGDVTSGIDVTGALTGGGSIGGSLGVGISRFTSIEIGGDYASLGATSTCPGCSGRSYDFGAGFVYHVIQGIAVDPWIGFGMAYRSSPLVYGPLGAPLLVAPGSASYKGFDFARMSMGASFYPTPFFGFGPFVELDLGSYLSRPCSSAPEAAPTGPGCLGAPSAADPGAAVYGFAQIGVRVELDPMRGVKVRSARAASR